VIATQQPTRAIAYASLLMAVVAASSAAILFKLAPASAGAPLSVAFYRLGFTALLLAGPVLWRWPTTIGQLSPRDLVLSMLSGGALFLHFAAWFTSLNLTSVASSTVLVATHPFMVLAIGFIAWGERVSLRAILGVVTAVVGVSLIGWGDFSINTEALLGDVLALTGALAVACYFLLGRLVRQRTDVLTYSLISYTTASVLLLGGALVLGQPISGFSPTDWRIFLALAVFPTIFGHTLFNWALRYIPVSLVSVSILGEPIGASILAWLIWHQIPPALSLVGGFCILTGITIFVLVESKRPDPPPSPIS
jgi:drug/metabolite transporter (DMT)-like permease